MAHPVEKTFSATGNSDAVVADEVRVGVTLNNATLNIQWQLDGTNWRTIEDGIYTSSGALTKDVVVDSRRVPVRVNCSAFTTSASCILRGSPGERVDIIPAA